MATTSTGQSFVPRIDGSAKALGHARYAADHYYPGMLYGAMKFSSMQHAYIRNIIVPALSDGEYVITGKDQEEKRLWDIYPVLARDEVRCFGDVVAIAAAGTEARAREIIDQIQVEYEPLEIVHDVYEGLEARVVLHEEYPDNVWPKSHHVIKKIIEEREPEHVFEGKYSTQLIEHAYIEPECAIAVPDYGKMRVYVSVQYPFASRLGVCTALEKPFSDVMVIQTTVGGSFGGKEESSALVSSRAAMLAELSGRPVKIQCSREESIAMSVKRHPFDISYKIETDNDGNLLKWTSVLLDDMGAYNCKAKNMNWRASVHAAGPYKCLGWDTDVKGVFTNNLCTGAMRGYSAPQIVFCHESLIDEMAQSFGKDIIAYRKQICIKEGDCFATGQTMEKLPFTEMLDDIDNTFKEWDEKYKDTYDPELYAVGKGVAISTRGCGFGAEYPDATGAQITLLKDGSVLIQTSLAELGQGLHTALAVIVHDVLGVSISRIRVPEMNTSYMEDGGTTAASRGTYAGGSAMLIAANKMLARIKKCLAKEYKCTEDDVKTAEDGYLVKDNFVSFTDMIAALGRNGLSASVLGWFSPETVVIDHSTGQGNAYKDYTNNCVAALSVTNRLTGEVSVKEVRCIHEIGHVVHRGNVENQIYGGVAMGLGMALMENCVSTDQGVKTANLDSYLIPTSMDMPHVTIRLMEIPSHQGPFGAKSIGEPSTECVAAAVARSVANGLNCKVNSLPLTQEKIVKILKEK